MNLLYLFLFSIKNKKKNFFIFLFLNILSGVFLTIKNQI